MNDFPHGGSPEPIDCFPRIQGASAEKVAELVLAIMKREGDASRFKATPAIIVAVWNGAMVQYLMDEDQCQQTIYNLTERLKALGG